MEIEIMTSRKKKYKIVKVNGTKVAIRISSPLFGIGRATKSSGNVPSLPLHTDRNALSPFFILSPSLSAAERVTDRTFDGLLIVVNRLAVQVDDDRLAVAVIAVLHRCRHGAVYAVRNC